MAIGFFFITFLEYNVAKGAIDFCTVERDYATMAISLDVL